MNPFVTVVNQKRVFAELLLDSAGQAQGQKHLQQALLQSAVFQLAAAYRLYLGEIAATYQCPNAEAIDDLQSLEGALGAQDKEPAETRELSDLNRRPESWLSQLLDCRQSLTALAPAGQALPADDGNRIAAVSSAERYDWSSLSAEQLRDWLGAFNALVSRHRESMTEW